MQARPSLFSFSLQFGSGFWLALTSSWFQVTVTDPVSMAQNATQVPILVHQAGILEWNMDGCNTLQDLWDAAQFWNQTYANDPNGDGRINVRDFQYINTDDPSCP